MGYKSALSGSTERLRANTRSRIWPRIDDLEVGKGVVPPESGVAFRKKLYQSLEELQADLDAWLREYNEVRPHQGRWCYGKTPLQTFLDSVPVAKEKQLAA